ncbi:MAG: type II toxin-antitoxin system RelE/ParE family toxin [Bacteroidota bacterium]|jgi:toxin ParE1/3/4
MASYVFSNQAVDDLSSIWQYTSNNWSEQQADKYYFLLIDSCEKIAKGRFIARRYPKLNSELYGYRIGEHIIFFIKTQPKKIEIIRILHKSMDLTTNIKP